MPKLIAMDPEEVRLWRASLGLSERAARRAVRVAGVAEILAGVASIRSGHRTRVLVATAVAMPLLAAGAAAADPGSLTRAFNPASLNWAVAALAVIGAVTADGLPSGTRPLRAAPDLQPPVGDLP